MKYEYIYIGQTGRSCVTRIKEHKQNMVNSVLGISTCPEYIAVENHIKNFNFKVLHIENQSNKK